MDFIVIEALYDLKNKNIKSLKQILISCPSHHMCHIIVLSCYVIDLWIQ